MPTRVMTNNLLADLNIFEFAKKNDNLRLLVYASSSEVVADQSDGPVTETNTVHVENIHNARWSYRLPKICAENYLSNSDLASLIIRYFNVYGADSLPGHFVADQINQIKNHRFDLIGGNETRCFCHVDDAIEATIKLMLGDIKDIVNIGNDQPLIIREAANIIAEFFGSFNVQWNELPGRSGSIKTRVPDLKKLYSYMPEYQPMNFKTGMNLIIQGLS
jgi:nucleoside-diphosphate-sugar epimerase